MVITLSTPLRVTTTHGTAAQAKATLIGADAKDNEAIDALWQLAPSVQLDAGTCWDQLCVETYDQGTPFGSVRWNTDLNPAGIGIPQDTTVQPFPIDSATEAIKIYLACLNRLVDGTVAEPWYGDINQDARTWIETVWKRHCDGAKADGVVIKTIDDLDTHFQDSAGSESTWAWDETYAPQIVAWDARNFSGSVTGQTYSTTIPGLPGGPLVTTYPVHVGIPGHGCDGLICVGTQRPGIKANTPRRSVQHGTGNANSLARDDATWILDGASGGATSVHAESDDHEVYVLMPLDEVSYQAADGPGPGNMCGFSLEMSENAAIWADTGRRGRCIFIAADFMGRIAARFGTKIPERHWDFNYGQCCSQMCDSQCDSRHHCPDRLMSSNLWGSYSSQWYASRTDELARMAGTVTPPPVTPPTPPKPPVYATPKPIPGPIKDQMLGTTQLFALSPLLRQMAVAKGGATCRVAASPWAQLTQAPLPEKTADGNPTIVNLAYECWSDTDGKNYAIGVNGGRILMSELRPLTPAERASLDPEPTPTTTTTPPPVPAPNGKAPAKAAKKGS